MVSLPISLPIGFDPVVSEKDTVTVGQVIAKKSKDQDALIALTHVFDEPVHELVHYLKKNPGDHVSVGDTLAQKKGVLGFNGLKLLSKVQGTVLRYERDSGTLIMRLESETSQVTDALEQDVGEKNDTKAAEDKKDSGTESQMNNHDAILSPLDGTVSLCNNDQIVIDTDKDVLVGTGGYGGSVSGELFNLFGVEKSDSPIVELHHLTVDCIDKVVLGGEFQRDSLVKAIGMGVKRIIAQDISEEDLSFVFHKKMETVIVTLAHEDITKLRKTKYKNVFVDGQSKTVLLLKA